MPKPDVFISWSKLRSKQIAKIVSWWVGEVVQAATPWYSDAGIEAGTRSLKEIEDVLSTAKIGIICITSENAEEPWLNFEAGALSKQLGEDENRVIPLLFGYADPADLRTPVSQFQGVLASETGFENVALSINNSIAAEMRRSEAQVRESCKRIWPELKVKLDGIPEAPSGLKTARSQDDLLREAVNILRDVDSKIDKLGDSDRAGFSTSGLKTTDGPQRLTRNKGYRGLTKTESNILSTVRNEVPWDIDPDLVRLKFNDEHLTIETPRTLSDDEEAALVRTVIDLPGVASVAFREGPPF